ncbi:MAG: hypothetical protein KDD62_05620, partial [Bdellovibrionales bacterium]|nr:hypothetical protein [Bdellovibrionales bacterium]
KKTATLTVKPGSGVEVTGVKSFSKYVQVKRIDLGSGSSTIDITILPSAPVGELREKVVIGLKGATYNSINIPLFASVKGALRLSPQTVSFGIIEGSEKLQRSVKLDNVGELPIEITKVESSHPALTGTIREVKRGKKFVVNLEVDPSLVKKDLRASLEIVTTLKEQSNLSVNVYGIFPKM